MERFGEKTLVYSSSASLTKVYKALDHQRNSYVALKEIDGQSSQEAESRFAEAENQQKLCHPAICRLYDTFTEGTKVVLVLEWMDKDLDKEIKLRARNKEPFTEEQVEWIIVRLVDALAYAESCGICHRDLKPSNLFLCSNGDVKIGDFGSSSLLEDTQTLYSITGTPMFLSPLLRQGYSKYVSGEIEDCRIRHDPYKSDVFSLGLTLLYILKLEIPQSVRAKSQSDIETEIGGISVAPWIQNLIFYMLQLDEESRPYFSVLRSFILDSAPAAYLSLTNPIVNLPGAAWDSLIRLHLECLLDRVSAHATLRVHCKSCGTEFLLTGGAPAWPGAESGYCSKICESRDNPQAVAKPPPQQQSLRPRRVLRIVKKPDATLTTITVAVATHEKTCVFCLSTEMQETGVAFDHCSKHMICSVECMQELVDICYETDQCLICEQPARVIFTPKSLQAELRKMQTRSEKSFATAIFNSPDLPKPFYQNLSHAQLETYQRIFDFLNSTDYQSFAFDLGIFPTEEMKFFQCVLMSFSLQMLPEPTAGTCRQGDHVILPLLIATMSFQMTRNFQLKVNELQCCCGAMIKIEEIAKACNRYLDFRAAVCATCHRTTSCQLCGSCGLLHCSECRTSASH